MAAVGLIRPADWTEYICSKDPRLWYMSYFWLGLWRAPQGTRILQSDQLHRPWMEVWWPSVLSQHSTHVLLQWTRANPRPAPGNKLLSSQQPSRVELMDRRTWYQGVLPVVREGARASSSSKDSWQQVTADSRQLPLFCSIGWQRFVRDFCWCKWMQFQWMYIQAKKSVTT